MLTNPLLILAKIATFENFATGDLNKICTVLTTLYIHNCTRQTFDRKMGSLAASEHRTQNFAVASKMRYRDNNFICKKSLYLITFILLSTFFSCVQTKQK